MDTIYTDPGTSWPTNRTIVEGLTVTELLCHMATMSQIIRYYCLFVQFCSFLLILPLCHSQGEWGEPHCKHVVGLTFESLMMKHCTLRTVMRAYTGQIYSKSYLPSAYTCVILIVAALIASRQVSNCYSRFLLFPLVRELSGSRIH